MGFWNKTCALSNLPILYGEEVYILFLVQDDLDPFVSDHCYSTTYYSPLPFFIEGKYNDYGAAEECHGDLFDEVIDFFKRNIIEFDLGENEYHDIPVKKENFDIKMLFDADHEGRLFIHKKRILPQCKSKLRVEHIQIKKSVLDKLLAGLEIDKNDLNYYLKKSGSSELNLFKRYQNLIPKIFSATETLNEEKSELFDKFPNMFLTSLASQFPEDYEFGDFVKVLATTCGADATFTMPLFRTINVEYLDLYKTNKEKLEKILNNFAVMKWLLRFMEISRKTWIVPSQEGSQNTDTSCQKLLAKIVFEEELPWGDDEDE